MTLNHTLLHITLVLITLARGVVAQESSSETDEFFEKKIRPLLIERCYKCHSGTEVKGSLRLDSGEWLNLGSESGPIVCLLAPALERGRCTVWEQRIRTCLDLSASARRCITAGLRISAPRFCPRVFRGLGLVTAARTSGKRSCRALHRATILLCSDCSSTCSRDAILSIWRELATTRASKPASQRSR